MYESRNVESTERMFLIVENAYAQASAVLSLVTNVFATSLIAYKAWCVLDILYAVQL